MFRNLRYEEQKVIENLSTRTIWNVNLDNYNCSQNICEKLYFSYEIAHCRKSSVSVFQEIFTSTDKIFILGGLGNNSMKVLGFFLIFLKICATIKKYYQHDCCQDDQMKQTLYRPFKYVRNKQKQKTVINNLTLIWVGVWGEG